LLFPNSPRSVRFEATAPAIEGDYRISATVEPVKNWDSAPGNNTIYGHLKVNRPLPYGPLTCVQGYVWREASATDRVCVTPAIRQQTWADNAAAPGRIDPVDRTYGPNTCKQGYVWREAFDGDVVCVIPETREQAWRDNAQ